jgi:chitinase
MKGRAILAVVGLFLAVMLSVPAEAQNAWAPNVAYTPGTLVTYNGAVYKCLQAHTSLVGWEPATTPALWQLQSGTPAPTSTPSPTPVTRPTSTPTPAGPGSTPTPTRTPTPTPTTGPGSPIEVTPNTATASTNDGNVPGNAVDNNLSTRWSANGDGQWIKVNLGAVRTITHVKIAFYNGNLRQSRFDLQVSSDDSNWTSALTGGLSAGTSTAEQTFDFPDVSGQWIRYLGHGNTANAWNSLLELSVFALPNGTGSTPTPTATASSPAPTRTPTPTVPPVVTPTPTPTPSGNATCPVKSAPGGKVLVGYWESWNGSGVHPGMGHIPIGQVPSGYNVINAAFPVIFSDGTMKWEDGMDVGVDVPTPQEICNVKANGHWVLLSIGGAAAGIDLSSSAVADRFISTAVPILKANNFDGIDIDIESGLVAGASFSQLSTSQANLIRIIDGILAQMPSNFMLTMAPETAYVTGGQIAYGGPWGAYTPIIKKYLDNGRLSWLQMQYYNGNMYGCNPPGQAYQAGTVEGFVQQTQCMMNGFTVSGTRVQIPAGKIVPGLPAQPGAGGGYMSPSLVSSAFGQVSSIKGLMTWSINWDGSRGYTFMNNRPF